MKITFFSHDFDKNSCHFIFEYYVINLEVGDDFDKAEYLNVP